jgi:hypothetical protein
MLRDWLGRVLIGLGFLIVTEKYADNFIEAIRKNPYDPKRIVEAWRGN